MRHKTSVMPACAGMTSGCRQLLAQLFKRAKHNSFYSSNPTLSAIR